MKETSKPPKAGSYPDAKSGLVAGGRGGPEGEMLIDGQEEVFSRAEVAKGRIEHGTTAGSGTGPPAPAPPAK